MLSALLLRYGYAMIFVAGAFEGDATLLTATFLAHRGYLQLDLVMLTAAAATVTINQVYFWAARRYGRERAAALRDHRIYGRVQGWITRYGIQLVIVSRFVFGFRIAIPTACGATGMSPSKFVMGDVPGAILWTLIVGFAGYAIGHFLELIVEDLRRHEWWIAIAIFAGALGLMAWRRRTVRRQV